MHRMIHICDHCGKEQEESLHECGLNKEPMRSNRCLVYIGPSYEHHVELCDKCYEALLEFTTGKGSN